jgi:gluconolactonase
LPASGAEMRQVEKLSDNYVRRYGVWVISPEGKHLGTIRAPEQSTNVGFGDTDKKTLYTAARTSIYKIRVNTPGI